MSAKNLNNWDAFQRRETPYSSTHKSHVIFLVGIYRLWNYSTYFLEERELEIGPNNSEIDNENVAEMAILTVFLSL